MAAEPETTTDSSLAVDAAERLLLGEIFWRERGEPWMASVYAGALAGLLSHMDLTRVALEAGARFVDQIAHDRGLNQPGQVVLTGPTEEGGTSLIEFAYVPSARAWTYTVSGEGASDWNLTLRVLCSWLSGASATDAGEDPDVVSRDVSEQVRALLESAKPEDAVGAVRAILGLQMSVRGVV